MKQKIAKHNAKVLNKAKEEKSGGCNCKNKAKCPIPGDCNQKNVVYQAEVHGDGKVMRYYGSTVDFKARYSKHKSSIEKRPALHTTLSSYIWRLKDKNINFEVKWSIKSRGHPFSSGSKSCDLCLTEKLTILTANQYDMLNKRDELLETCRHRRKHLLITQKEPEELT